MTTAAQIAHPLHANTSARRLWLTSQATRTVGLTAFYATLGYLTAHIPHTSFPWAWIGGLAVLYVCCRLLTRWTLWLSWSEVPGAWRPFESEDAARQAFPPRAADLTVILTHALITALSGPLIAAQPGLTPSAVVGFIGGGLLTMGTVQAGRAFRASHIPLGARWALALSATLPALPWIYAGTGTWALLGSVLGLLLGLGRALLNSLRT